MYWGGWPAGVVEGCVKMDRLFLRLGVLGESDGTGRWNDMLAAMEVVQCQTATKYTNEVMVFVMERV